MSSPKVSIVTICYNAEKELPITLESVLAQDYHDFEYIIQEGNSSDNSASIIESYRSKFTNRGINFIYNRGKDAGIYDAMNKGVASCSGEYINFMNAGDCFYSASVLSNIFTSTNTSLADSTSSCSLQDDVTIIYGDCAEYEFGRFNLFIKNFEGIEEVMPFSHQSVFAKRDFLLSHPFNLDYRYSADYDFLLSAYDEGVKFHDSKVIVCITTKDGLSSVNYHDMLIESATILKSHNKYHHTEKELAKIEKVLMLKQFVLDHFPVFIKKAIRTYQINKRGQNFDVVVPPWYK